jgi:hypothetical protein
VTDTFRVGLVGGIAQITVAVIALVGTLATADGGGSSGATAGSGSSDGASCTAVYERYRTLVRLDDDALTVLTTPGTDGLSPIEADPDARRCGLSEAALRAMG